MMLAQQKSVRFTFVDGSIGSLSATSPSDDAKGKEVESRLRDDTLVPTSRFWDSLFRRYRVTKGIFRLFNENEVFRRIHERAGDSRVRFCIEQNEAGQNRLLGVSSPRGAVPQPNSIVEVIKRFDGANLAYSDGVFRSTHIPRADESNFLIGPDAFQRRFVLESPVDGHGSPRTCLALLREICTNGMVAECAAFRSEIRAGDDGGTILLKRSPRCGLATAFLPARCLSAAICSVSLCCSTDPASPDAFAGPLAFSRISSSRFSAIR